MKTTKTTVILLALVLLIAAAAQPAEAMVKPKISNTRTASCLVKITSDPAVLPLSDIVIGYLLHSSGVAGKAARDVLDISPDDAFQLFTIEDVAKYSAALPRSSRPTTAAAARRATAAARTRPARHPEPMVEGILGNTAFISGRWCKVGDNIGGAKVLEIKPTYVKVEWQGQQKTLFPVGVGKIVRTAATSTSSRRPTTRRTTPAASTTSTAEQTYLLKLQVELDDDAKPAAEEFMNALIENLRRALSDAFDDYRDKIKGQQDLADEETARAEIKLVKMQKELRSISDYRDLSRNVIFNDISRLRTGIQSVEMQKASYRIEMESIGKEIADTEVKIRVKVRDDPITIELQRIVDIQTNSLKSTQELVKEGAVSSAEVDEVLEKLARARIEIAKRREEISKAQGGNRVSQLSSKLAQYTRQMAQYELSLSEEKKQLDEARDFLDRADDYELLSLKADIARQSLEEALLWLERIERKARLIQPPAVTVLGGS